MLELADKVVGKSDKRKDRDDKLRLKRLKKLRNLQRARNMHYEKFSNMDSFISESVDKTTFQRKRKKLTAQEACCGLKS